MCVCEVKEAIFEGCIGVAFEQELAEIGDLFLSCFSFHLAESVEAFLRASLDSLVTPSSPSSRSSDCLETSPSPPPPRPFRPFHELHSNSDGYALSLNSARAMPSAQNFLAIALGADV